MNALPTSEPQLANEINFSNTEIAFSTKSDKELRKMSLLFRLMGNPIITNIGSKIGLLAIKLRLPFVKKLMKSTIFEQFCGGESLLDCQSTIDKLYKFDTLTVLDYGAEGKSSEEELDGVVEEFEKAIEFAASNNSVPVITIKITGLVNNDLLNKVQQKISLTNAEQIAYEKMISRVDKICKRGADLGVGVFIDAEESWLQESIDEVAVLMMSRYNISSVIVYNTYQMYRHDKLAQLKHDHNTSLENKYMLGAKLVRGAYMEKEKERAEQMGYESPIHNSKAATDRDFDLATEYCVKNYETIGSCCATHNQESNRKQADLITELGVQKNHRHLNFCQLYGMSDNITFNIANAGFNVAKYVPYGPLKEVVPYLIRRAQENTSVTGEISRELSYITKEIKRRGL